MMKNKTIIIFDTETTGFPKPIAAPLSQQPSIIEFAGVKVTDDDKMEVIEELEFKCKPPNLLSEDIKKFHKKVNMVGLTDADLAKEKSFPEHYKELATFFFSTYTMLAHNIGFDRNLMKFELMRIGKVLQFPWPIAHKCSIEQTMAIKGYKLKLTVLYEHLFNEPLEQEHRAMNDVVQLLKVCKELRKRGML